MKRLFNDESCALRADSEPLVGIGSIDEVLSSGFKEYLISRIIWGSNTWHGSHEIRRVKAVEIVESIANELSREDLVTDISSFKNSLKSKIESIARVLRVKDGSLEYLSSATIARLFNEYQDNNSMNNKVYHDISHHHKKIKNIDWSEAVGSDEALETYAEAAVVMGNKDWVKAGFDWIHECIQKFYFCDEGIKYCNKLERRRLFLLNGDIAATTCDKITAPIVPLGTKLRLLDVGSCFNPFKSFDDLEVTAIDLCPADSSVFKCDFLNVNFVDNLPSQADHSVTAISNISRSYYNALVMSLVISYLPSPEQRMQMVINARKALDDKMGMFLIYEKGSILHSTKYYEKFLKHWKMAISSVGFDLYKYEKIRTHSAGRVDGHTAHVFVFITKPIPSTIPHSKLWIKQDFQEGDLNSLDSRIQSALNIS